MSNISTDPYLFFRGNADEAMNFYKSIFGGELEGMKYGTLDVSAPEGLTDQNWMHLSLNGGDVNLMASDTVEASEKSAKISIALGGDDEEKLTKIFNGLSEGVTAANPLTKEVWGDIFGTVTDKYGIEWMVNINSGQNTPS
jgi:PhnB protein